jgi:hypothetical protein
MLMSSNAKLKMSKFNRTLPTGNSSLKQRKEGRLLHIFEQMEVEPYTSLIVEKKNYWHHFV